ncbi:MAG: hypothetical protein V4558_16780 [Gemmatimonadota bacterium]
MKVREVDYLALLTAVICIGLGVASHNALNPDGVSYLDLATRLRDGDWQHFVQGYWSPLYPLIIALAATITGRDGPELIGLVHVVNTLIALFGVAVVWWAARRSGSPLFGRTAFAAFLVCSAEAPRLEAVTPDLLLVAIVALIGGEQIFFRGSRWIRLGVWMGLAFLVKTSMWPWLLAALIVRLAAARSAERHLEVAKSAAVGVLVMALWVIPLSVKSGAPTLGSAARLNACWYMRECDSRSPDTHSGEHRSYQQVTLGSSVATATRLSDTPWTYAPWSDPTAWAEGIITARRVTPDLGQHALYGAKELALVIGIWMPHIWLGLLLPIAFLTRRSGALRELRREQADAGVVMALGIFGVLQFVPVHVEPRLVAPFVLLFTLGALAWLTGAAGPLAKVHGSRGLVLVLSCLGFVAALPRAAIHGRDQWDVAVHTAERATMIANAQGGPPAGNGSPRRIAVIGEVFPLLSEIFRLGRTVDVQLFRPSVPDILTWPPGDQQALLNWLGAQGVAEAWLSKSGGAFTILPVQAP